MNKPLLVMRGITKRFPGVLALNSVDLEVLPGEVHTLLGENGAGKSTLIKVLTGAYDKDEGQIFWDDQEVILKKPLDALRLGIAPIYQELNLVPKMTVAENIFLGREPRKAGGLIDHVKMRAKAKQLLSTLGLDIDPKCKVHGLGMGYRQMVEIARALSTNARMVIMDEPTSSLSEHETELLLATVRMLRDKGVAVIYISHRLEEILAVTDRVTVMRDGSKVETVVREGLNTEKLIRLMVGRKLTELFPKAEIVKGREVLRVEGLRGGTLLKEVSFDLREGEIIGLAGLVGAGRTEAMRALFGVDKVSGGKVSVFGREVKIDSPRKAIKEGLAFLTEDRKGQGLVLIQDVAFNSIMASMPKFLRGLLLSKPAINLFVTEMVKGLKIKTPSIKTKVRLLSGGNQQKVVIAKWVSTQAKIFIFDEPTRGIDVGAKVEVYNLMNELAKNGAGIIMVSSELPEVLGMSDRIFVMHEGVVTGQLDRAYATQEKIMKLATGG